MLFAIFLSLPERGFRSSVSTVFMGRNRPLLIVEGADRRHAPLSIRAKAMLAVVALLTSLCPVVGLYAHETQEPRLSGAGEQSRNSESTYSAVVERNAVAPALPPNSGGRWSDVYEWPVVAVHAALLPNGKVLAWDATPDDLDDDPHTTDNYTTRVTLWDPVSNTHVSTNNNTDTDLFCAGSAHLWDGRILFAGGDGGRNGDNGPLVNTNIYNPVTNTWHRAENMNAPRWYSSVAALSNGEMLTLGGSYFPDPLAEVFQFDQTWRALSGEFPIELSGDYQWLQQTPQGTVLSFGPSNLLLDINTAEQGLMTPRVSRDFIDYRDYGSYAMFDVGKILVAGGAQAQRSAVIIDTATHQTVDTGSLIHGRRQHNLTILADGSVMASGGNGDGEIYYSPDAPVYTPELWQPSTESWTALNKMQGDRQYHSIALLLSDGTVLSAGGGLCGECTRHGYEERNAEIFYPPYLFDSDGSLAARPRLGLTPPHADFGETIFISIEHDRPIAKAHLIKLGSTTHSENQDQRLVPLSFEQRARRLTLTMPTSRHAAPPGHYLLFVLDDAGVPSPGAIIKLGQPLIKSGQTIKSTLEHNVWDGYLIEPMSGQVSIELNGPQSASLFVSATKSVTSAEQSDVICSESVSNAGLATCSIENEQPTALYVGINGVNRGDYTLNVLSQGNTGTIVYDQIPTEQADTATQNPVTDSTAPRPASEQQTAPETPAVATNSIEPETNTEPPGSESYLGNNTGDAPVGVGFITKYWVVLIGFLLFWRFILRRNTIV